MSYDIESTPHCSVSLVLHIFYCNVAPFVLKHHTIEFCDLSF